MEDPVSEISNVVNELCTATSPDIQRAAMEKYFTTDAGFKHPLCYVPRGRNSRDDILRIYQSVARRGSHGSSLNPPRWYRIMSPNIQIKIKSIGKVNFCPQKSPMTQSNSTAYEPTENVLYLDIHQIFHIRLNPFAPASAR
jgi:hypothetical protein